MRGPGTVTVRPARTMPGHDPQPNPILIRPQTKPETVNGLHLTADLRRCAATKLLVDEAGLRALCREAVAGSGLTVVGELFHPFPPPGGVTGVVLLAESHLALHTWPELGVVTLDVYVCNASGDHHAAAEAVLERLLRAFRPESVQTRRIERGALR